MTLKDLKQYRSICVEIDEMNIATTSETVRDTVRGSDAEFPYITHTMSVKGVTYTDENRKTLITQHSLEMKKREIEGFIDGIEDSLTRRIFEMRFIKGFSWNKIAAKTCNTAAGVKMICYRYINRQC